MATAAKPEVRVGRVPARASGLELLGEFDGSGYREPRFLVRRIDGQTFQLPLLLYRLLELIDGEQGCAELAQALTERIGKRASADDVCYLVDQKLQPLGILQMADGS